MRNIIMRVVAALPDAVIHRLLLLRERSGLLRALSAPLTKQLRSATFVIPRGVGRGLRMDARAGKLGHALGANEPEVQQALQQNIQPGDVVYDIGANIGFFTLIAARLTGPRGRVYAFEPLPALAEVVRANADLNGFRNVVVIDKAAHSTNGSGVLDVTHGTTGARIVTGEPQGEGVTVALTRVDDLVAAGTAEPPTLVKIDVEGAERHVFDGMWQTISAQRPIIICELHGPQEEFMESLRAADYDVSVLDDGKGVDNPHIIARPR